MASAIKRRITYADVGYCEEGEGARVYIKNQGWFLTTRVIEIVPHPDGPIFETQNSIYRPTPLDGTPLEFSYKFKETRNARHCKV